MFGFREPTGPCEHSRTPPVDIHVVRRECDLLIDDAQGVVIIVRVGVLADFRLPGFFRLLRLRCGAKENRSERKQQQQWANAARWQTRYGRSFFRDQ